MLAPDTLLANRYRIVELLATGGMGAVYKAVDEDLNCTVAVKETFAEAPEHKRFFKREASLLANLRHSALPKVTHHFFLKTQQFLVMEYIPGKDLMQLMIAQQAPFPLEKVLRWSEVLLDALIYLHTYQPEDKDSPEPIIHRDIKPANLKLTPREKIILLDFGLAKGKAGQMSSLGKNKSLLGFTPGYAPLEQVVRADWKSYELLSAINQEELKRVYEQGTDTRTDLFSLAATLYHLLTGRRPSNAEGRELDVAVRAMSIWTGKPDPLVGANEINPQVTTAVAEVLTRALALDRSGRYNTAEEMLDALREAGRARPSWKKADSDMHLSETVPPTVPSTPPKPYVHLSHGAEQETEEPTRLAIKYGIMGSADDAVRSVSFSPNGLLIASGGNDNVVRLWEAQTGAMRILGKCGTGASGFSYVSSVAFAPDGVHIASGSNDKTIRLWDAETNEMLLLGTASHPVRAIDFSRNGKLIVAGSSDGTINLLDVETQEMRVLGQCEGVVWAVAFSPSTDSVASESDDNTIHIWNLSTTRMRLLASQDSDVRSLAYSPDGETIAFGGWDRSVRLLDVRPGNMRTLGRCEDVVRAVAFSPDGKRIASASDDRTIRIWNIETGRDETLGLCDDVASTVAFAPDGRSLASGSWDTTVRIWKIES
ncbi:MAG TPA: serine/threonine-protein kinase [Pyrinomonadaceae bacterium]|jgi:WD40 repeat protein